MTMQLTKKQKSEGWRIVKFGEIAKSVSKRVDHQSETELEVYVGLEHLDPDNLFNLSIPLYVTAKNSKGSHEEEQDLQGAIEDWRQSRIALKQQTNKLFDSLKKLGYEA